jgi:CPA2 family monovalent cation:H+ antiporter-2
VHGGLPLAELAVLLALAAAGAALFERLRLPAVAGFLVAGALVGPGGLALVADPAAVRTVAEAGVFFLLFEIGLELPVERLRRLLRRGLAAGALQVAATLAATAALALALGVPLRTALVLGALVAMSSTALVVRLLSERGELDAPHGQLSVAILLFQDLCIVPFLLAVPLLASEGPLGFAPIAGALARAGLTVFGFYAAARFLLPRILSAAAGVRSRDVFSLVAVLVVVGAAVGAEGLGLSLAVGAFLAGLAAAASPWGHQLFAEVLPLRGVLLGVFFTAVGMLLDFRLAWQYAGLVAALALAATALKAGVVAAVLGLVLRVPRRVSALTALALAQTGEFSFVLAAAAVGAGLLSDELSQAFIAASVLSLVATPFLLRAGPTLLDRRAREPAMPPDAHAEALSDHVLVIGHGLAGRNLTRVLQAIGIPWLAVDANPISAAEANARDESRVVYGDATRPALLERLGVRSARIVVVAITDPVATRRIVALVRRLNPTARLLARTRYVRDIDGLHVLGASAVVAEELEAAIDLLTHVLREFGLASSAVSAFVDELRDEGYALLQTPPGVALDPWLAELLQQVATEWIDVPAGFPGGRTLAGLGLRARTGASVLAVERAGRTTPNPPPDHGLEAGDRLLVFGGAAEFGRMRELLAAEGALR